MVSPQPIYNLSSPFVLIVDKGGERDKDMRERDKDMRDRGTFDIGGEI